MVNNVSTQSSSIPQMSAESIEQAREIEKVIAGLPQIKLCTEHVIHAGVYSRTILIEKGAAISGVVIKRPVNLIISGHVIVALGNDEAREYNGYFVLTAMANRKQIFIAKEDTILTMFFATDATTVEEAEGEFTDEVDILMSRHEESINNIVITGV